MGKVGEALLKAGWDRIQDALVLLCFRMGGVVVNASIVPVLNLEQPYKKPEWLSRIGRRDGQSRAFA